MKCIRFDVCKFDHLRHGVREIVSSMKCIRFDVCKLNYIYVINKANESSMKCIRFDVCKHALGVDEAALNFLLNEVHTF